MANIVFYLKIRPAEENPNTVKYDTRREGSTSAGSYSAKIRPATLNLNTIKYDTKRIAGTPKTDTFLHNRINNLATAVGADMKTKADKSTAIAMAIALGG